MHDDDNTPAPPLVESHGGKREGAGRKLGATTKKTSVTVASVKRELGAISEEFANATPLEILEKGMRLFASAGMWAEAVSAADKAAKYRHPTLGQRNTAVGEIGDMTEGQIRLIAGSDVEPRRRKAA